MLRRTNLQPIRGSGEASWAPPAGSGAEPRPLTHFWQVHRTLLVLVERTVLLYWIMYKAQKATCSYENKMMHKVKIQNHYHLKNTGEKCQSNKYIRPNICSNSHPYPPCHHQSGNTSVHRFRLIASCILTMTCSICSVTMEKLVRLQHLFQLCSIISSVYGHN